MASQLDAPRVQACPLAGQRRTRIDSLDQGREIVERKHTQLHQIREKTAARYVRETATKYPENALIQGGDGRIAPLDGLAARPARDGGPTQRGRLPQKARDAASKYNVTIRHEHGTVSFDLPSERTGDDVTDDVQVTVARYGRRFNTL